MRIIAIDPGVKCGVAVYEDGELYCLYTSSVIDLFTDLESELILYDDSVLAFEDSRLISHIYTAPGLKGAAKLKVARNVGQVDAICSLIADIWGNRPIYAISPKNKGAKINSELFKKLTGWQGRTNQHERDAAMIGLKIKGMK